MVSVGFTENTLEQIVSKLAMWLGGSPGFKVAACSVNRKEARVPGVEERRKTVSGVRELKGWWLGTGQIRSARMWRHFEDFSFTVIRVRELLWVYTGVTQSHHRVKNSDSISTYLLKVDPTGVPVRLNMEGEESEDTKIFYVNNWK